MKEQGVLGPLKGISNYGVGHKVLYATLFNLFSLFCRPFFDRLKEVGELGE